MVIVLVRLYSNVDGDIVINFVFCYVGEFVL